MIEISMEEIENMLPEQLSFVLCKDSHEHGGGNQECLDWILKKEAGIKMLLSYLNQKNLEIYNIKNELEKRFKNAEKTELFYDHRSNRIYKRAVKAYGEHPGVSGFRKDFHDRPETTSEEEGVRF